MSNLTHDESKLTRAQYRALKSKQNRKQNKNADHPNQSVEDSELGKHQYDQNTGKKPAVKTDKSDQTSHYNKTQVFKRTEDLDAPRKFSADFLNQEITNKAKQAEERDARLEEIGHQQKTTIRNSQVDDQSKPINLAKQKPSLKERFFDKKDKASTSSELEDATDTFTSDRPTEKENKVKKPLFGTTKIDRFLNISIILLTIGIIILTIIAFYF